MKRSTVIGLMTTGAVLSLAVFWPTGPAPMASTVVGCTFEAAGETPAAEGVAVASTPVPAATAAQPETRAAVVLTVWRTTDEQSAFYKDILAALPHIDPNDSYKLWSFCPADSNRDGRIDPADLAFFMSAWTQGDTSVGRLSDVNRDGVLDDRDHQTFIDAYFNGDCSPEKAFEYILMSC